MEPPSTALDPFIPHLLLLFVEMLNDTNDDVRNSPIYWLVELVLWAGEPSVPHYSTILANISKLLGHETCPGVVDQIVAPSPRS